MAQRLRTERALDAAGVVDGLRAESVRWIGRTEAAECSSGCRICAALRDVVPATVTDLGIGAVTQEELCARSRLPASFVAVHNDVSTLIVETYVEAATALQRDMFNGFLDQDTWAHGLRTGLRRLFATLHRNPELATFCFVEAARGDEELYATRESVRQRSLRLYAHRHAACSHGAWPAPMRYELLHGAFLQQIADHARSGRVDQLTAATEALVELANT